MHKFPTKCMCRSRTVGKLCFVWMLHRVIMLSEGLDGCHDNMACMLLYYCTKDNAVHR